MNKQRFLRILVTVSIALTLALLVVSASAQDVQRPSIEAVNQLSTDGTVVIARVITDFPAFVVIYADNGEGSPGNMLGYTAVEAGEHSNLHVAIANNALTPTVYAAVHMDDQEPGVFEFGSVEGADAMSPLNGDLSTFPFAVSAIVALDQIVREQAVVQAVTVGEPTWVVIYAGDTNNFGEIVGHALVPAGTTTNLAVEVAPDLAAEVLWPMLHVDTGTPGQFDIGTVEGADTPLVINDQVATLPISSVPIIRVAADQLALAGNGIISNDTISVEVGSVLSDGAGFLVVYNDEGGNLGSAIGFTPVPDGLSSNVTVDINAAFITPNLWFALHSDDHAVGTFEFGSVEDADPFMTAHERPVNVAVRVAPFINLLDNRVENNALTFASVLIDQPGFVALHTDNPLGPVIANQIVNPGLNENVSITLDTSMINEPLYPVLHLDTDEMGVFEFDAVEGADVPLLLNGQPISTTLTPSHLANVVTTSCTILADVNAPLYGEPNTSAAVRGTLEQGLTLDVTGQLQTADGVTWWQTTNGDWISSDLVAEQVRCQDVPLVAS